jgi:hypothetical protein
MEIKRASILNSQLMKKRMLFVQKLLDYIRYYLQKKVWVVDGEVVKQEKGREIAHLIGIDGNDVKEDGLIAGDTSEDLSLYQMLCK